MNKTRPRSIEAEKAKLLEKRWITTKYKPEYDQMLLDHLTMGLSFGSFDIPDGVSYQTLVNWCKKYPSFAQAREIGEKAKLKLLESEGIKLVKGGNVVAWKFLMSQYGMGETVNVKHEHSVSPHMKVAPSIRYARLQKIKELHQRVSLQEEEKLIDREGIEEVEGVEIKRKHQPVIDVDVEEDDLGAL